ncbi:hypothetical protein, conserved [Leishmania lindenbergi]|uniref:C3H1-type domain-containing protein n=1 Tax=Leishmania lindenbergi TaxID=651832 RepID=A0AAW3B0E5_9TRYP
MSWWNDFSTHRNNGVVDGSPRQRRHQSSDIFSLRKMVTHDTVDHHVHRASSASTQNKNVYIGKTNLSGAGVGGGFASHEPTWETSDHCSDAGSLWQTTTSVGSATRSDQLDVSDALSAWALPSLEEEQEEQSPAREPLPPLLLFPPAHAVNGVQSSFTMGDRRVSGSNSSSSNSSGVYSNGGSIAVPSFTTDYYEPSFMSGTGGVNASAATHTHGGHVLSSTNTIDDITSVVSGSIDDADEDILYDEMAVSTISSLIAALQVRGATNLAGGDALDVEDDEVKNAGGPSQHQHESSACDSHTQADTGRNVDITVNSAASMQQLKLGLITMSSSSGAVFQDPSASFPLIASLNTTQSSSWRHSSNVYNDSTSGSAVGHNASCSSGLYEASLGEAPSGTVASASGRAGSGASPRHHGSEMVPLRLTPSVLHNVLASFQSALVERSSDVKLPSSIGDLFSTSGWGTSSQNGSSSSGAAGGSRPYRYDSPTTQEEWGSQASTSPATAGVSVAATACGNKGDVLAVLDAPAMTRNGSPMMRGRVNSVVAHKLNLDVAARRAQLPDLRGSGCIPPAAANIDCTCTSDIHTPTLSAHSRLCVPQHVHTQELAASSDSSVDHVFAHTVSSVPGMLLGRHERGSGLATAEGFATLHHHTRTTSEVSLPAAAATYHGGSALQQRIDDRGCIAVVDPQRRKLHVPLSAIQTTKALNGRLKTPSLCLLYQSGRCRQGDNCYQVHIDTATVERLRVDVKSMPCCCFHHGDCNSHRMDCAAYEGRSLEIAGQFSVPLARVAYTAGLQRVLQDQQMCAPVNPSVLCRLHGQPSGCRFGADCRFVHICCLILQNELASIMANAVATWAASSTLAAAQQQQQQQQSRPGNGPSLFVDLMHSGLIPSSSGTMHGGANAAMLSFNDAASSAISGMDCSPSQVPQVIPVTTTAASNAFASRVPPSSQQQKSSTPSSVTVQPLPCAGTFLGPSAGTHYTLTTLQPQVSQVQTPAGRPSPLQASVPGSPASVCHAHMHTLSTQSNGSYQSYGGPTLKQTPSHSEVASPMSMGLLMSRSVTTFPATTTAMSSGSGGAFPSLAQSQLHHQATPPQRYQSSALAQQEPQLLHLPQLSQLSTSQQIYVQQMSADGSVSIVPITVMQDFGGGGL